MGYLRNVVCNQYLSNAPDRFEWCRAWKKGSDGKWEKKVFQKGSEPIEVPFPYMHDTVTGDLYIAHNPQELSFYFTMATIAVPIEVVLTISFNIVKVALLYLNAMKQTFDAAYSQRAAEKFNASVIDLVENYSSEADMKARVLIGECRDALYYGSALVAALAQAQLTDNVSEQLALWTVIAQIEKLWNNDADFRKTPATYALRIRKCFEQPGTVKETADRIQKLTSEIDFNQMEKAFYILQCFQPRGNVKDDKFKIRESFSSYAKFMAPPDPTKLDTIDLGKGSLPVSQVAAPPPETQQ